VRSFFSLPDNGPKSWWQGRTLPTKIVDINSFGLLQLVDFITEHCLWGSKQYLTLWRDLENYSMNIKSDENLLEWFLLNIEKGLVCINAQVIDFHGPLQFSPTKRRFHPSVRSSVLLIEEATNKTATNERATNKTATNEIATNKTATNERGTNEEGEEVQSDSSYDTDLAASSDSGDDSNSDTESNPDAKIVDEEDEYDLPMFTYDADDPCIGVNVIFPDTDQCKLAVTHHAVLHDHAFDIVKKDRIRFRAKCKRAEQGCKLTFFASTSKKYAGC